MRYMRVWCACGVKQFQLSTCGGYIVWTMHWRVTKGIVGHYVDRRRDMPGQAEGERAGRGGGRVPRFVRCN